METALPAGTQAAIAALPRRFVVLVGRADGDACRIEAPDRLLRLWSLLCATSAEMHSSSLPAQAIPGLRSQLRTIRAELEDCVSPPLIAELRHAVPPTAALLSADELRTECAALLGWTGSLTVQMVSMLTVTSEHRPPAGPPRRG